MKPFGGAWLSGHREVDEDLLNDPDRLIEADPSGMLRALASAGAQVRESTALAAEFIEQAPLDEEVRQLVCHGNAQRIFGL